MKTKQEQIAEMAVIGCVRNPQAHTAEECAKCDFKQEQCNAYRHAEALYNAGYRKTFTSDIASDTQKAFKEGYKKGCEICAQAWANGYNYGYKSGKEDGVREFAEKVKGKSEMFLVAKGDGVYGEKLYVSIEEIDELLKEY